MSPTHLPTVRWTLACLVLGCANADPIGDEGSAVPAEERAMTRDAPSPPEAAAEAPSPQPPALPPVSSHGPTDDGGAPWDADDDAGLTVVTADADGDGGAPSLTVDVSGDRTLPSLTADAGGDGAVPSVRADAATCGTVIPVYRSGADVLVVLDRSCSMARSIYGRETFASDPNAKWNLAVTSLRAVLGRYDARVRWGVVAFPNVGEGCATPGGGVDPRSLVEPQPMGADAVVQTLGGRGVAPFDVCSDRMQPHDTPLARALEVAATTRAFRDGTRAHHVLLVTDGIETCDRNPVPALTRRTQALRDLGVRTAVVGFGRNESPEQLEAIAVTGGTARASSPRYHTATDAASLGAALDAIAGAAADCGFTLRNVPADESRLRVVATGAGRPLVVPRDPTRAEGWDYDRLTRTLTLYGAACAGVRAGSYTNLNVTHDCPAPRCVPQPEVCDGLDNDCDGVRDNACARQP